MLILLATPACSILPLRKGLEVAYNQIEAWARRTTSESTMRGPSKVKPGCRLSRAVSSSHVHAPSQKYVPSLPSQKSKSMWLTSLSKDSSPVLVMRLFSISAYIGRTRSLLKVELNGLGENRSIQDVFDSTRRKSLVFMFDLGVSLLEQLLSMRSTLFPTPD